MPAGAFAARLTRSTGKAQARTAGMRYTVGMWMDLQPYRRDDRRAAARFGRAGGAWAARRLRAAMLAAAAFALALLLPGIALAAGAVDEELSEGEATSQREQARAAILAKTVSRPGGQEWELGAPGGTWLSSLTNDPKTFNTLTARDGDTRAVVDLLFDHLADYDPYEREFIPNLASFTVEVDEEADSLTVFYTLRDDLYWTTLADPATRVPVTSADVVFWYDEIEGDQELQQPGYAGQFIELPDGSEARIEATGIDARTVAFHYPRIVANPILSTNMSFGPRHLYEPAKRAGGAEGVLNLFSIDTDPATIPSVGPYYVAEYEPGVRVVAVRNPNYWKRDAAGVPLPYLERVIYQIVPDRNTELLLFKEGNKDSYSLRPEDLDELLNVADPDFTVYNGGASLGSAFIAFNQNPDTMDELVHSWFSQTRFRQAMSALLNRDRIASQVYRGLAEPALHFFARANPYFDESIRQEFSYDPERARELLAEIGIRPNAEGLMEDAAGNHVEFNLHVGAENNVGVDVMNIFADELKAVGITGNVRAIDFQKLVEMLTSTYDWHVATASLGANYWPSGGSNVWQSKGNFHLWHPLQEEPATDWEARVDYLYNEGRFTIDRERAKAIYDEYQRLLLDQAPMTYIVHPLSFVAVRDKWANVFYDTLGGLDSDYLYLRAAE